MQMTTWKNEQGQRRTKETETKGREALIDLDQSMARKSQVPKDHERRARRNRKSKEKEVEK